MRLQAHEVKLLFRKSWWTQLLLRLLAIGPPAGPPAGPSFWHRAFPSLPATPPLLATCSCNGEVLLLQRTSKHNHGTWGLPGGNADAADADLLATATREAREEMGDGLPPFQVAASVLTKRGKR